ncbi:methylamine utilization protein, partial [Mesorhizobium sp. M2D.F.Ca.ET.160.01.1.1]
ENPLEQAGNRTAYAHYMKARFGERYERIFGPLPDFSGIPLNASPLGSDTEKAAWNAMSDAQRDAINSVYANIGKAIAAFERSIEPTPTRFDRFALDLA